VLGDDELRAELRAMTDAHTDLLAGRIGERVERGRPWSFVNGLSRLVVDPERFPDEARGDEPRRDGRRVHAHLDMCAAPRRRPGRAR
jgi:hypothetical protein